MSFDFNARDLIPLYASIDPEEYVRAYDPKRKHGKTEIKPERVTKRSFGRNAKLEDMPLRMIVFQFFHDLWKKRGIAFWVGFVLYTLFVCAINGAIVRNNTSIRVREQIATEQSEKEEAEKLAKEEEESRKGFWTGEESLQKAIEADADILALVGQGVLDTYEAADIADAEKAMVCVLCRVLSGGEFAGVKSIYDAVMASPGQWWGIRDDMRIDDAVKESALNLSNIYHRNKALPCKTDMVYASWNGMDIVLRNRWEDNSNARRY